MGHPTRGISPAALGTWRRRGLYILLLLLLLLLLLVRRGTSAWHKGETCRRWREGCPLPVESFLCPQKSNRADAWLCCGTCTRPYCCSSMAARLDQQLCFRPGQQRVPTPKSTPEALHAKTYLLLALVMSLVVFLFLGWFVLVECKWLQHRGGARKRQQDPFPLTAALHPVSSSGDLSRPASLNLPSPHSSSETLVPSSSEEDSQRDWDDTASLCPEDLVASF